LQSLNAEETKFNPPAGAYPVKPPRSGQTPGKGKSMTLYEAMTNEIENLVTLGRAGVPGIREKLFIEAEELREKRDALTVGERNQEFAGVL
jgi:hypothetical protein